jgi:rhamnosyltransferase subunit B
MQKRRKIVLATHGSLGDLHPFIALGLALVKQGFDPVICSHANFQHKVEAAGLEFHAFGPCYSTYRQDLNVTQDELVMRMSRDHAYMLKYLVAPYLEDTVLDMMQMVADADMVIGTAYTYGAHIAASCHEKPYVTVALQPAVLLSVYDPPKLKNAFFNLMPKSQLGRVHNHLIKAIGSMLLSSGLKPIEKIYKAYDLPPQNGLAGIVSQHKTLALYSPLLGKVQPDFPPETEICGFPFYDSDTGCQARLSLEVEAFLNQGPAPLVFSLGSLAIFNSVDFYRKAIVAAKVLGQRCIILAGHMSPLLAEDFGKDVLITSYAPHSLLFPRCALIIHHGGIGSCAQALRSGRPQVITPVFADQFDNAHRLEQLGCARVLEFDQVDSENLAKVMSFAMSHNQMHLKALLLSKKLAGEDGAETAARIISSILYADLANPDEADQLALAQA